MTERTLRIPDPIRPAHSTSWRTSLYEEAIGRSTAAARRNLVTGTQ